MCKLIETESVSEAWYLAVEYLLSQPNHRAANLLLAISRAPHEVQGVRDCLDRLLPSSGNSSEIERVADTLFPQDFYDAEEPNATAMLFERRKLSREFEVQTVPKGNYFDRMVEYPTVEGSFNQIEHVLTRLRANRNQGANNSNVCEVGLSEVGEELRIQTPGVHRGIMGFPCLSHVSITLCHGKLNLAATYRSQDFVHKAYGNLLGLGRLMNFFASESGFEAGELLCVATGAILDPPKPGGMRLLREVATCVQRLLQQEKNNE